MKENRFIKDEWYILNVKWVGGGKENSRGD